MERRSTKSGAIEGMKDSLYSREHETHLHTEERTPLSPEKDATVGVAWSDARIDVPQAQGAMAQTLQPKKRLSFGVKFLLFSFAFFVIAIGVASYVFFVGGNTISPQNIDIQVLAPSAVDGGKPTTFEIIVNNRNQSPLQLVDVTVDYPDNTRDPNDQTKALIHDQQSVGSINAGAQIKRTSNAVLYGQEGATQKVLVTLQYSVPNSNAVFQKQAEADVTIGSSPVSVSIQTPNEAISDQVFTMDVTVTSNATTPIQNVILEGQYPFGYVATNAAPAADSGGSLWRLGTLNPGQSKVVHLTGSIVGQDGDERVFRFLTGADADQTNTHIKVPFIVMPQTLTVHKSFITASLALNGDTSKSVAIQAGKTVDGVVTWKNNLTVPVANVQVVLTLVGPMLDTTAVTSANGFYQSQNNTILWSKDQDASLAEVPPGGTGTFQFLFKTLSPGAGGTVYANPTISLDLAVSGVRQGQTGVPENVSSAASVQATIASAVTLTEAALHFSGPFQNTGPMPPRAESATTYTINWTIQNSSNTIANTLVSTILPSYVQFVAASDPKVTYDRASRTVSWAPGDIKAGAGFSSAARTTAFQVSLLPSTSQTGQVPSLTGSVKLTGQDRFAQVVIDTTAQPATTQLQGDTGFVDTMGVVVAK